MERRANEEMLDLVGEERKLPEKIRKRMWRWLEGETML
jgi:hypothetical protein